uniref:Uncharacterized protein n=1 Tax=Romanomermis culicivorax TaxID=13658 RepID=A0A915KR89_ROMCU
MAKHTLGNAETPVKCQVATAATDSDLTDHEPAALDKSLACHTDQQKLDFALNKMTTKTYITAVQKAKALCMLRQNRNVFSLPGNKPTITNAQYIAREEHHDAFEGIKKALTSSSQESSHIIAGLFYEMGFCASHT